ncbi:MAG: T9SS type A sorting domain-containing protein [Bacteroidota bacterium]
MKHFCILCSLLLGWSIQSQLFAQADCNSALPINTAGSFTATFDNTADFSVAYNGGAPPNNGQYGPCAGTPGQGDVWFTYSPGGSNLVQTNIRFGFTPNFDGNFNIFLFYSESFEIGDPCEFPGGNVLTGLTRYQELRCNTAINAGNTLNLDYFGLDGSGVYLIVVERVSGNAVGVEQMTITPTLLGACPAPANDACANPAVMGIGNGIIADYNLPGGSPGAWTEAIKGTNACATKERLFDDCVFGFGGNPPTPTEDHYGARTFGFGGNVCLFTGNLGDNGPLVTGTPLHADEFLENTVYYQFTVPSDASTSFWYLNIGASGPCSAGPNDMVVMVFNSLNCADADASNRIAAQKMPVNGSLPSALHTFGLVLNPGSTYYVVVDGTRGSQCDFCMLLTTSIVNPVLPATVENLDGWNEGPRNVLQWQTSLETQHDYFEVERRIDGENFTRIGSVDGVGESNSFQDYRFADDEAPYGQSFYRLGIVDIQGNSFYTSPIEVFRKDARFGLHEVYPVPFEDELIVEFSTENTDEMYARLYDLQGKLVLDESLQPQAGTNRISLATAELPQGMYVLRLEQNGVSQLKKVIK